MLVHLKPRLMWRMLFVANTNLTNITELGDVTFVILLCCISSLVSSKLPCNLHLRQEPFPLMGPDYSDILDVFRVLKNC